jgi:hypothetical protein
MRTVFSTPAEPDSPSWSGVATGIAAALPVGTAKASTAATVAAATIDFRMPFLPVIEVGRWDASANAPFS